MSDMDISKILASLRQERKQIEEIIFSLERLAQGGKRRGRSPLLPIKPRRPPKTRRAGAFLQLEEKLADAIATYRRIQQSADSR